MLQKFKLVLLKKSNHYLHTYIEINQLKYMQCELRKLPRKSVNFDSTNSMTLNYGKQLVKHGKKIFIDLTFAVFVFEVLCLNLQNSGP